MPSHAATTSTPSAESARTKFTFRYFLALAGLCTLAFACCIAYLLATGHGLLWLPDGLSQYFTYFVFVGEAIRTAVSQIAAGEPASIGTYVFNQGYGSDFLITLGGNIVNPFYLVSALVPTQYAEIAFYVTIWMRMLLAACMFSLYCFNKGKTPDQTLVGTMAYVLCGFVLFWGVLRHPGFLNTAVLLPLILMGTDRIFDGKRPTVFVVSLGILFLLSVYFTYMVCFFVLGYCILKYFLGSRSRSVGDFFKLFFTFAASLVLAFALGAATALPTVLQMTSMERVGQANGVEALFTPGHYLAMLPNMVGTYVDTRGLFVGIVTLLLIAVLLVGKRHFQPSERRPVVAGLALCLVIACSPWLQHVLNGMSYASDRWMIMMGFCAAYAACLAFPALKKLGPREWKFAGIAAVVLLLIAGGATTTRIGAIGALATLALAVVLVLAIVFPRKLNRGSAAALSVLMIASAAIAVSVEMAPQGDNYADEFIERGKAAEALLEGSPATALQGKDDWDAYRFSIPVLFSYQANSEMVTETRGTSFYSSNYNSSLDRFRDGLGIWSNHLNYLYGGNSGRLALDSLIGARYFAAYERHEWRVPYGYKSIDSTDSDYLAYENDLALPLGFVMESTIAKERYDALSLAEKQEALLQACVLDQPGSKVRSAEPKLASKTLDYKLECSEGVVAEEGRFVVTKKDAEVTVKFEGLPKAETYLFYKKPAFNLLTPDEKQEYTGKEPSIVDRARALVFREPNQYRITVVSEGHKQNININSPGKTNYVDRLGFTANAGYSEEPLKEFTLSFPREGIYRYDSIQVLCQPVEPVIEALESLKPAHATDIELSANQATMKATAAKENSYAVVTLPYSRGWSAWVDGQQADVLKADVGFMAVELAEAGEHEVTLRYQTPGLAMGLAISAVALVVFIVYLVWSRKRRTSDTER